MYLRFSVHKLESVSENSGKVHFEGLVNLLRYIRDNKTSVLKYYADMNYAIVSDLLRHAIIKIDNLLMDLSVYSCQDCPNTGRIIGA